MKRVIEFVRANYVRIISTSLLLFLAFWWGPDDLGVVPAAVAVILWTR